MVEILTDYNINDLMFDPINYPDKKIQLYKVISKQTLLTDEEILKETIVTFDNTNANARHLIISDEHTYCKYYPEDYNMTLSELEKELTDNLVCYNVWGV